MFLALDEDFIYEWRETRGKDSKRGHCSQKTS